MTPTPQGGSAKIYQFPVRGRLDAGTRESRFAAELEALRASRSVFGDGWYHDDAIKESTRTDKR